MKVSMWGYFLLFLGLFGIVMINLFGGLTIYNEQDYTNLKELVEASMIDSIDYTAYREGIGYDGVQKENNEPNVRQDEYMHCITGETGQIRIVREKFVESFARRFAENANSSRDYRVIYNDIDECPPKVSVTVVSKQQLDFFEKLFGKKEQTSEDGSTTVNYETDTVDAVNTLTAILETGKE